MTISQGKTEIRHVSKRDGLPSDYILFLGQDARGQTWVGTDYGAAVWAAGQWIVYTHEDGMVWDDCAANAFWPEPDGAVWIGTLKGLSFFRQASQPAQPPAPPSVITSAKLGQHTADPAVRSEVPFRDHDFLVSFAGLTFLSEKNVRFRYRLVGLDHAWIETALREVRYSSLPAGSYRFEVQARKIGMNVLGRDRLDPKQADYATVLTKIKSLGAASLYFGGNPQAGIKVVKQSYEILPGIVKGGGDGIYEPDILSGAGFPACEGWYATIAAPHLLDDPKSADWVKNYATRYKKQPNDYCITCYDAVLVIADALGRLVKSGGPITRAAMRDAIEATKIDTLQGTISFDKNGDLTSRIISVFQIRRETAFPPDDMQHQFKYVGVAPQEV